LCCCGLRCGGKRSLHCRGEHIKPALARRKTLELALRIEKIISGNVPVLVLKSIAQLVFVIYGARFCDVVFADGFAHRFNIRVRFIARHVDGYHAQTLFTTMVAPLVDARHVLFADAATDRPEMHEGGTPLRFRFGVRLRAPEPSSAPSSLGISVPILIGIAFTS
jgi:hypothetical protein